MKKYNIIKRMIIIWKSNVKTIRITYSATINENAIDGEQTNNAKLNFGNNLNVSKSSTTITTYEAKFVKVSNKTKDGVKIRLTGAKFSLYDALTGGNEIKVVKVSEGVYRVATAAEIAANDIDEIEAGEVTIKGLANNTSYYLQEDLAPDGYTKLANRVELTAGTATTIEVVNTTGVALPSTGGIGTTLFVLVGTIMVLSLGTVLVSKYRMTKFNA